MPERALKRRAKARRRRVRRTARRGKRQIRRLPARKYAGKIFSIMRRSSKVITPPKSYCETVGLEYGIIRTKLRELSQAKRDYALYTRMSFIRYLQNKEIWKIPSKHYKLVGALNALAARISNHLSILTDGLIPFRIERKAWVHKTFGPHNLEIWDPFAESDLMYFDYSDDNDYVRSAPLSDADFLREMEEDWKYFQSLDRKSK